MCVCVCDRDRQTGRDRVRETHTESCTLNVLTCVICLLFPTGVYERSISDCGRTNLQLLWTRHIPVGTHLWKFCKSCKIILRERGKEREGRVEGVGNSDVCLLTAGHLLNFMEATGVQYCFTLVLQSQNIHMHVSVLVHMPAHTHTHACTHTNTHTHTHMTSYPHALKWQSCEMLFWWEPGTECKY